MSLITELATKLDASAIILILVPVVVFLVPVFILFPPLPVDLSDALRQTRSRLGKHPSNDRFQWQKLEACSTQPGRPARIESLHIYPVKSCQGIELSRSKVMPKGLEYDRLFTFARRRPKRAATPAANDSSVPSNPSNPDRGAEPEPEWEIVTLRQLPRLANVRVDLWLPDETKHSRLLGKISGGFIVVTFPWIDADARFVRGLVQMAAAKLSRGLSAVPQRQILLPLEFPTQEEMAKKGYRYEGLRFFSKTVEALNMACEVPPELALYLGAKEPMSLFRMDPQNRREVLQNAPRKEVVGFQPVVDFQDEYPLHLLNLNSVRALESKILKDDALQFLDPMRFRPNIVVSGLPEYDEDDWRTIQARSKPGSQNVLDFDVSCRAVRCKLPNVDPATGIRHKSEPDHALRKYRNIDEGAPKSGCLGMQLCPLFGDVKEGILEAGMELHVLQRGPHFAL